MAQKKDEVRRDPDQRMAILFTACAIDMILKESNN